MRRRVLVVSFLWIVGFLLHGCAGLQTNLDGGKKISSSEVRVMVFPLRNPYYKGRQIVGIGDAFATALVSAIQSTGRTCKLADDGGFTANEAIDVNEACLYAHNNGWDIAITGIVAEWLDGATQWSGKVDVAAVTLYAYDSESHKMISSASGRQNGQWFTFVNAPTTRFLQPLSQTVVKSLFD